MTTENESLVVAAVYPSQQRTIEELRVKLSETFGVTVVGQHVTVRWHSPETGDLLQVTMVMTDVTPYKSKPFPHEPVEGFADRHATTRKLK